MWFLLKILSGCQHLKGTRLHRCPDPRLLSEAKNAQQCQAAAEWPFPLRGRRLQGGAVATAPCCPRSVLSPRCRWCWAHKGGGPSVSALGSAGDRRASPPDLARLRPGRAWLPAHSAPWRHWPPHQAPVSFSVRSRGSELTASPGFQFLTSFHLQLADPTRTQLSQVRTWAAPSSGWWRGPCRFPVSCAR